VLFIRQVCHILYPVNAAYRVIVPRDAVAGIPADYGAAMIANTLSLLATITTTDDLLQAWQPAEGTR
jgi:nicotinamidase-related amidase